MEKQHILNKSYLYLHFHNQLNINISSLNRQKNISNNFDKNSILHRKNLEKSAISMIQKCKRLFHEQLVIFAL